MCTCAFNSTFIDWLISTFPYLKTDIILNRWYFWVNTLQSIYVTSGFGIVCPFLTDSNCFFEKSKINFCKSFCFLVRKILKKLKQEKNILLLDLPGRIWKVSRLFIIVYLTVWPTRKFVELRDFGKIYLCEIIKFEETSGFQLPACLRFC